MQTSLGDVRRCVLEPALEPPARGSTWARALLRAGESGAALMLGLVLCTLVAQDAVRYAERHWFETTPPVVNGVDVYALFVDDTPVPLTITAGWQKVPYVATADEVRTDPTLWRRMHIQDWDTVPTPLRTEALDTMLFRYRDLVAEPRVWDAMTAHDWDVVPQPVRALAFRHMAAFWSGYYRLGAEHGITPRAAADAVAALLMTESWFEHRAVNVNRWGNRDLGLAQAADTTRARMVRLYRAGVVDVLFEEEDYFDPWKATRFAVLWLRLLLDQTGGDLDAAIRAYHRGTARALRGEGEEYLAMTKRRLAQLTRREDDTRSLDYLQRCDRALRSESAPWLSPENAVEPRVATMGSLALAPGSDVPASEDSALPFNSVSTDSRR